MSIATVRRTDGDAGGDSAWAVVARADSRLKQNDLAGAVTEMQSLKGESKFAAQSWLSPAQARVAAERVLNETTTKAIGAVAASGDKPSLQKPDLQKDVP